VLRLPGNGQAQAKNSVTDFIAWGREMDHNDIRQGDLRHCWNNNYSQGDAYNYIVWGALPKEKKR